MTYAEVREYYKTDLKIAAELGVSFSTVQKWKKKVAIPRLAQLAIQTLTKNKLIADKD